MKGGLVGIDMLKLDIQYIRLSDCYHKPVPSVSKTAVTMDTDEYVLTGKNQ